MPSQLPHFHEQAVSPIASELGTLRPATLLRAHDVPTTRPTLVEEPGEYGVNVERQVLLQVPKPPGLLANIHVEGVS